jgi:tRNA nucleotidyltransferase (CCA-adding enzyme)
MSHIAAAKKAIDWHDLLFLEEPCQRWMVYFMILTREFDEPAVQDICTRLQLPARHRAIFCHERFQADEALHWLAGHLPAINSVLYRNVHMLRMELLLYIMGVSGRPAVKKAISHYFTKLRHTELAIRGDDLKAMGIPPGPIFRKILDAVTDAKLNGRVKNKKEESEFARNYWAEASDGGE